METELWRTEKRMKTDLEIRNVHKNKRFPGIVYAELYDGVNLVCSATLEYCVKRLKKELSEKVPG